IIQTLSANGVGGLGIGTNIIHVDLGARRAWGYNNPAGGGAVPKWAQAAIDAHLAGKSTPAVDGVRGKGGSYKGLTYSDREKFIA
ncbi:hypothetical protein RXP20_28820, partial [Pseudomonas aeruginosa]|nr:hypothetical protein [Pseudomonas aeruginosa]